MKLFEVLKAGWKALDEDGKEKVISEVSANDIFRQIVMSFDQQYQAYDDSVDENLEPSSEDDDDIIEAEFTDMKDGFGA